MTSQARYQVFVSSTYDDLREERQQATQAILEAGFFPSGMELFPASNDRQWDLIKRVIEESDYYIVIIAGRYGSLGPKNVSYTEMEYDFAVKRRIPVLGFVYAEPGKLIMEKTEKTDIGRQKLEAFRAKVMSRTCAKYSSATELGMAVMKSIVSEARVRPRTGWVRADQARSDNDLQRERKLADDLAEAEKEIKRLQRSLRDKDILGEEIPREVLAQGEDVFEFNIVYQDADKKTIAERVGFSWDTILKIIGPSIYGFIVRRVHTYNRGWRYNFEDNLEAAIREKVVSRAQNRAIKIQPGQVDSIIIQFKELRLIHFDEKPDDDGELFRGVSLTPSGERRLSLLSVNLRVTT